MELQPELDENFDPQSATIAELRGILMKYGIDYGQARIKVDYVNLFNELKPKLSEIRASLSHVKRSGRGIVNAQPSRRSNKRPKLLSRSPTKDKNLEPTRTLVNRLLNELDESDQGNGKKRYNLRPRPMKPQEETTYCSSGH